MDDTTAAIRPPAGPRLVGAMLQLAIHRPRAVLAAVVLATAVASAGIPRITLQLDGRSLVPAGAADLALADQAAKRFGLRDVVVVGIADGETIFKPDVLRWITALGGDLARVPGIVPGSITSLATLPRLFVEHDVIALEPLLDQGRPIDGALADRLARETVALGLADGILVARDNRTTVILAEVAPEADRRELLAALRELLARPAPGGAEVSLTGTALAQAVLGHACAVDLLRLLPAVIMLVAVALTVAFRDPVPAVVSLAEIAVSLVVTAGVMGFAGESIFVTTLVLPVVVLVIGVSDDVYALHRFMGALSAGRESGGPSDQPRGEALFATFSDVGPAVLLTAATTVSSLLSLLATDLTPQRTFGLYGALAILLSTLLTFTLVPSLLMLLPLRKPRLSRSTGPPPHRVWRLMWRALAHAGPNRVLVAAAMAVGIGAAIAPGVRIEDDWVHNLPPSSDIARGDRHLNEKMAGTTRIELMLDTRRADGLMDPDVFAFLGRLETALRATPGVGAVTSVYSEVFRVRAALDGVSYAATRASVASGGGSLPAGDLESALLLLASLRDSPLDETIDVGRRRARISVVVRNANYSGIERTLASARAVPPPPGLDLANDLTPFGDGWVSYVAVRKTVTGQVASVGLGLLCNGLLVFLLMRSLRLTLIALVPVTVVILTVFAGLALTDHPLGIASSMFTAVALGVGIDYSTHLVSHFKTESERNRSRSEAMREAFEVTGPAIVKSTVAVAAGFAALGFSTVLPNRELGLLIPISLVLSAAATLLLVPCMVLAGLAGSSKNAGRAVSGPFPLRWPRFLRLIPSLSLCAFLSASGVAVAGTGDAVPAPKPTALDLVGAYNGRNLGSPGWRRVGLQLETNREVTRRFTVVNLWRRDADVVRTLFVLEAPEGLRGTNYLLVEDPAHPAGMQVFLHLPAGQRRVLSIESSSFDEGLLGSDFGYRDLRMQIPTRGFQFERSGETVIQGTPAWIVSARAVTAEARRATPWLQRLLYFSKKSPLLVGTDFFSADDPSHPRKSLRVLGWRQVDDAWTETEMVMTGQDGRSSRLILENARFGVRDLGLSLFAPRVLPTIAAQLQLLPRLLAPTP